MENPRYGKRRNPVVVVLLSLITFGIYFVYWYYKINKEIAVYDDRIETSPLISALAITIGAILIIPPYISAYTTAKRVERMFRDFESPVDISPLLALILYLFIAVGYPLASLLYPAYMQHKLNLFWRHESMRLKAEADLHAA